MNLQKQNKISLFLICITLLGLPLYIIRCKNFSWCSSPIPFTLLEIIILITFSHWFFLRFRERKSFKKIIRDLRKKIPLILQLIIVFFLFFAGINVLFSEARLAGLGFFKAYFLEPFLFFIVIFDTLSRNNNFKIIFWAIFSNGVWVSLLAVSEKLVNFSPFNQSEFLSRGRTSAVFQTSNSVGLLLGPLIVILVGYFFFLLNKEEKTKIALFSEKTVTLVVISILGFGLWVSGSRGAIFGIVASFIFFFGFILYKKIKENWQKFVRNIFFGLTMLFFILNLLVLFNLNSIFEAKNKIPFYPGIQPRLCLWNSAVHIIKHNPLVGNGLGGFTSANKINNTCRLENTTYPHNIFLNFWTEIGLFGLISFICLCAWFFFNLIKDPQINYLKLGMAGAFISILFHGLVDVPYLKNDLSILFWAIIAISLFLINQESLFTVVVRQVQKQLRR